MIPVSYTPVRKCNDCREVKLANEKEFGSAGHGRLKGHCKACDAKRNRIYKAEKARRKAA